MANKSGVLARKRSSRLAKKQASNTREPSIHSDTAQTPPEREQSPFIVPDDADGHQSDSSITPPPPFTLTKTKPSKRPAKSDAVSSNESDSDVVAVSKPRKKAKKAVADETEDLDKRGACRDFNMFA